MKVLVVLSAVAALSAAQYVPFANHGLYGAYGNYGFPTAYGLGLRSYAPAAYYGSQYHAQDTFGGYQYGYADGRSTKMEQRRADGATVGSYTYVDANGQTQRVSYTAGAAGFQVDGTNLPVAPTVTLQSPEPVQDTAEVRAARAEFQAAFAAAAARQRRSAPQPVQDTAEVAAEKARFRALYAESAAAAAAGATPVATYLEDTAEVAAEKARFRAAFDATAARAASPLTRTRLPLVTPYNTPFATPFTVPFRGFYNGQFAGFNRFFY